MADKYNPNQIKKQNYPSIVRTLIMMALFFVISQVSPLLLFLGIRIILPQYAAIFFDPEIFLLISLFATAIPLFVIIIYTRYIEKRTLFTFGSTRKNPFKSYCQGFLWGAFMISLVFVILLSLGAISAPKANAHFSLTHTMIFFIAFLIQGMHEEVLLRGFLFISLSRKMNVSLSAFISALLFAILHLGNAGINMIGILNLVLFGIFACLYFKNDGNLWGISAFHSAWNFFQGNIFGLKVSGIPLYSSLLQVEENRAAGFIHGSNFGPEGGIAATVVLICGIIFCFYQHKNKFFAGNN